MGNNYYKVLFISKPVNLICKDVVVKDLQPQKYASRTSGTETAIGNSLKEVLAHVLPKQNRKK